MSSAVRHWKAYDVPFSLSVPDEALFVPLQPYLPPCRSEIAKHQGRRYRVGLEADGSYHLSRDGRRFAHGLEGPQRLGQALESDLNIYVACRAPNLIAVHAGVVGWKGRVGIFPGASFVGKSRLVFDLVSRGAIYYSDEYALCDPTGLVHAYPRYLALRRGDDVPPQRVAPDMLGRVAEKPGPAGLILFTSYAEGATSFAPEPMAPGAAVLELLHHTVAARQRSAEALAAFARVVQGATALRGPRPAAEEVVDQILRWLEP